MPGLSQSITASSALFVNLIVTVEKHRSFKRSTDSSSGGTVRLQRPKKNERQRRILWRGEPDVQIGGNFGIMPNQAPRQQDKHSSSAIAS
jgi:hypothetical protein